MGVPVASPPAPRLVLRFALYSAAALLLAGLGIFWFVRHEAQIQAERAVLEQARLTAGDLSHHLRPDDFRRPAQGRDLRMLDELFAEELTGGVVRIRLWSPDGVLTYSNDHARIGARAEDPEGLRQALAGSEVLRAGRLLEDGGPADGLKVLEARTPVALDGVEEPVGVLEIAKDYTPVEREIKGIVTPVGLVLGLALVFLYAALFPILRQVTNALHHRNRRLVEQATELERTLAERERAVVGMRDAESRYRELVEQLPLVTYVDALDETCSSIYISPQIEPLLGYTPEEWLADPEMFPKLLHPDDRERVMAGHRRLLEDPSPLSTEYRLVARDGRTVWFHDEVVIVRDDAGRPVQAQGFLLDITERKVAEEALRESETKFRAFVETTEEWVWEMDREGMATYSNPAVERILGYTPDEVVGVSALAFMHEDDRARLMEELPLFLAEKKGWSRLVFRWLHRDGSPRLLESNATPILSAAGDVLGWRGSDRDVTESMRAAEQLERRNAELLALHETSFGLIERLEADSVLEAVVARAGELLGTSHAYVYLVDPESDDLRLGIGTGMFEDFVGYRLARGDGIAGLVWESGQPVAVDDYGAFASRRTEFEAARVRAVAGVPLRSQSAVIGVLGLANIGDDQRTFGGAELELLERFGQLASLALDNARLYTEAQEELRERRRAEEAVVEAETRYRTLVEQLPLVTYIRALEIDGEMIYVSPQIEGLFGYSVAEWHERATLWAEVIHPDDRPRVKREAAQVRRTGKPLRSEYRCVTKTGETVWVLDETHLIRDEAGAPLWAQGYLLDVTARKVSETERERLLAEAQDARGALAEQNERLLELDRLKDEFIALVSHELRTPLTSIRGYLELMLDGEAGDLSEEQAQFLAIVERNSHRLLHLVGDLLFLAQVEAGKLALEVEAVDLAAVASESVEAVRPLAEEKDITLTLATGPVPLFAGDAGRMAQLLDNLVSNALKFTPERGRVDVRVRALRGEALLEVRDTGMGIPAEEQERLFERFFRSSTAAEHAIPGTGLGLAISKAIAEAHGGTITMTSREGEGTTFRVAIPIEAAALRPAAEVAL